MDIIEFATSNSKSATPFLYASEKTRWNEHAAMHLFAQDFPGIAPDVMTFNIGISAFMALHRDDRAFQILREMDARRIRPRADTFNTILTGLTKVQCRDFLEFLYKPSRANVYCSCIKTCRRSAVSADGAVFDGVTRRRFYQPTQHDKDVINA